MYVHSARASIPVYIYKLKPGDDDLYVTVLALIPPGYLAVCPLSTYLPTGSSLSTQTLRLAIQSDCPLNRDIILDFADLALWKLHQDGCVCGACNASGPPSSHGNHPPVPHSPWVS